MKRLASQTTKFFVLSWILMIPLLLHGPDTSASMSCERIFDHRNIHIKIADDEVGLFGYGSLLNIQSVEATLGRRYTGPILSVKLSGWSRQWDVALPNEGWYYRKSALGAVYPKKILYLNIQPKRGKDVNGIVIVIKKSELQKMDQREMIYSSVDVTRQLSGIEADGGSILTYTGRPEFLVSERLQFPEVGLRASYLSTVNNSLSGQTIEFRHDFDQTTAPFPKNVLFEDVPDYNAKWD